MQTELSNENVAERVIQVIADTQHIPKESISLDSTYQQLKIDSLDGINIVFALENEFDISIPDEGIQNLQNVRDTVAGVQELINAKRNPSSAPVE